ncbi:MAG: hypothetical protein JW839_21625, partial [Candidatus Lokiarchaeota archaeon]|nr:hypothetical protein [Candidatus Lokiarchaeota archaeon]
MGRTTRRRARAVALLGAVAAAVACCAAVGDPVGPPVAATVDAVRIGTSAGPDDPVLWYRHTNATIGEMGYDIIVNGSNLYAVGLYAVDGIDTGLLVSKWTTGGQHVWNSRINQLPGAAPLDG